MNPKAPLCLCTLSLALALGSGPARADDAANPPPAPPPATQPAADPGADTAPAPHHGKHGGLYSLEELTQKLTLTADQQKQVGAVLKSARQQGKAVREDDTLSKDDRWAKMRDIAKASHDQIRALLTPDQQKLFDAMPAPGRGGKGPAPAPTAAPTS